MAKALFEAELPIVVQECFDGRVACGFLQVAVVPGEAPLLMSKHFFTDLDTVLYAKAGRLWARRLQMTFDLREAGERGHFMLCLDRFPVDGFRPPDPEKARASEQELSIMWCGHYNERSPFFPSRLGPQAKSQQPTEVRPTPVRTHRFPDDMRR